MKGWNIGPFTTNEEVRRAAECGGEVIRYHCIFGTQHWPFEGGENSYMAQFNNFVWHIDNHILPGVSGTRAKVIINVLEAPGGINSRRRLNALNDSVSRARLLKLFLDFATKYKDEALVLGYSLNEPGGSAGELGRLMFSLWATITRVNDQKIFCVTNSFGQPGNFDEIAHIDAPNVWHEVHCYEPMRFTHQGISGRKVGRTYPSLTFGKRSLARELKQVTRFQRKHPRAQIFMGEFGASIYADTVSRERYAQDCIDICNDNGWHWAYHSFNQEHNLWTPTAGIIHSVATG